MSNEETFRIRCEVQRSLRRTRNAFLTICICIACFIIFLID